jgi:predicted nucleotidyltransferase
MPVLVNIGELCTCRPLCELCCCVNLDTMKPEEVKSAVTTCLPQLRSLGVDSLALFGSVARGEAGATSDVDLLVRFTGPVTFDRFMDVKLLLEDILGRRVDLVTEEGLRTEVRPYVERDLLRVA